MAGTRLAYRTIDGKRHLATRGDPIGDEPTAEGWRAWDPERSKLGAMIDRGLEVGLEPDGKVLYLGAAAGTTASHVADVARIVYAVEFAPRPMRNLLDVAESRTNLVPLLSDAHHPETYGHVVESNLDLLVQDVATTDQAAVALTNRRFLADEGRLALAIKARSEDVTAEPADVFESAVKTLEEEYEVLTTDRLDPLHEDHLAIIATPR